MGWLTFIRNGLVFVSKEVSLHKGAFLFPPERPCACDKCHRTTGRFHAHGRYQRFLNTLRDRAIARVKIWIERWLCLECGRPWHGTA